MPQENVDVCIIGGGIVGLYCAAELAQKGYSVRIIDKKYATSSRDNIGDLTFHGPPPLLDEFVSYCSKKWQGGSKVLAQDLGLMPSGSVNFAFREEDKKLLNKEYETDKLSNYKSNILEGKDEIAEMLGGIRMADDLLTAKINSPDMTIHTHVALDNLRKHVIQHGVRIWGADVATAFLTDDSGTIKGVKTDSGDTCLATYTIICAGIYSQSLLKPLEINIPMRPARCHLLDLTPNGSLPLQVVVQSYKKGVVRIRSTIDGRALVSYDGLLDPAQATYSDKPKESTVEWLRKEAGRILPVLHNAKVNESKVVTLAVTPDFSPCVGAWPSRSGLLIAMGMSGKSYAYAAGVAGILKAILEDEDYPISLMPIQPDRFNTNTWEAPNFDDVLPNIQPLEEEYEQNEPHTEEEIKEEIPEPEEAKKEPVEKKENPKEEEKEPPAEKDDKEKPEETSTESTMQVQEKNTSKKVTTASVG